MRETAAERALVAHLNIADRRRRLREQRAISLDELRLLDLRVCRERADADSVAFDADVAEIGDATEIDDVPGLGQPQLHQRHEALPAGEKLHVVSIGREQMDRLFERYGLEV